MPTAAQLLLATALVQPGPASGERVEPHTCGVALEIDGLSGGLLRHFYPGQPDDFYLIQLQNPQVPGSGPFATWQIDDRPPARPRVYGYQVGRPEAVVFRQGPDSVSFGMVEHGEVRDGPIWVRMYGDGAYAGTFLAQTARRTRRQHRLGARAVSVHVSQLHQSTVVANLAGALEWRAVLVDSSGRELGSKTVRVPGRAQVEAEFIRARAELLRHRDDYLANPERAAVEGPCQRIPSDEETI
ncbi:MAG TPA: hypothetical protein VEW25_02255 [Allosphingosinicella sp.]|nr:hypothetical protein [Allosphingosinicella sp.]